VSGVLRRLAALQLRRFARDGRGATAIEYAMMAALIGGAVLTTVWSVGSTVRATFFERLVAMF
jgi:pilus assembly protein Flp/PilA